MSTLPEKLAQVESLKMCISLKYLLGEAYKILGNPLLMFDMDNKLIEYCEGVAIEDPMWDDIIEHGIFSEQTVEFAKNESFIDEMANARDIALLRSEKLKYDRFVGKIYSKDAINVARLLMIASDKQFGAYDAVLFEALCAIISKKISTDKFYQNYAYTYQDMLITKLIDRNIRDRALYTGHMANIYGDLREYLHVGVVDTAQCNPEHSKLAYFRDWIKQMQPNFKYAIYSNYIVMIMSFEDATVDVQRDLRKLNKFFKQKRIYAGVSDCFDNIYELAKYYEQAVKALNNGRKYSGGQRIFLYNEVN